MQAENSPEDAFFYEMTQDNRVQKISVATGEVVTETPTLEDTLTGAEPHRSLIHNSPGAPIKWTYQPAWAQLIASHMGNGGSITSFCKLPGSPSLGTMARWRGENKELEQAIKGGKKMRAEAMFDQVIDDHEKQGILAKEEVQGAKHRFDRQKYMAKMDAPELFSEKVDGTTGGGGVTIIVDTGFRDKPKDIEGECYETNVGQQRSLSEHGQGPEAGETGASTKPEGEDAGDAGGGPDSESASSTKGYRLNGD